MAKINFSRVAAGKPPKHSIGWHARRAMERMKEAQSTDSNQKAAQPKKVKHV
ncbi:MAG: hypothetical protein ACYTBJ_26790 [Planctomycetota bacterium]